RVNPSSSVWDVRASIWRVYSASATRAGVTIADTAPSSRLSSPLFARLGAGLRPFPFNTKICLPSRLNIAPVGYQPVGMKPCTKLSELLLISTTATVFVSAFATSSVCPSGENASELGVAVGGACGKRLIEICSMASHEPVSNTQTAAVLLDATNRRLPSGDNASALG